MRRQWRALAAVPVCLFASAAAVGANEGPNVSAVLRSSYFSSSRTLDDRTGFVGLTGELKANWDLGQDDRLDFHARSGFYGIGRGEQTDESKVTEGYWLHRGDTTDLRIGQQRISWGRTDGINPTDFFTPYDYTTYLPLEEDQRLTVPAVRADIYVDDAQSLSLVAQPGFIPTHLPEPRDNPLQIVDRGPPDSWSRIQAGARYTNTGENLDWSLAAFRGYAKLPLLSLEGANAQGPVFARFHPKIWGLGADLAHNFGRYGFRGELAYVHPDPQDGRQTVQPYFFFVGGVDRSIDDWNFNVQAVVHHTPDFVDPADAVDPAARIAATQNATLFGQTRPTEYGMTARIAADWRYRTIHTELLTFVNINTHNYFLRPLVTYAIDDRDKLLIGGEYYHGPDDSFFGQLKKNQTIFIEYRRYAEF